MLVMTLLATARANIHFVASTERRCAQQCLLWAVYVHPCRSWSDPVNTGSSPATLDKKIMVKANAKRQWKSSWNFIMLNSCRIL